MPPTLHRTGPSSVRLCFAALAACIAFAIAPAMAGAAAGSGAVTLGVGGNGKAAKALAAAGVKAGAIAPATKRGTRLTVPVRSVAVGTGATVLLRGGIRLAAGKRAVRLRSLRVELTAARAIVSARAGDRRLSAFTAKLLKGAARLDVSRGTAKLAGARLLLTGRGAGLLRARLGVGGIRAGVLGRLRVDARPKRASGITKPGTGGSGGAPSPGPGAPQSAPIENEPPLLARPEGAVDITSASLTWRPRESWIQYINGGQGTSVFGGAADGPLETKPGHSDPLVYSFVGFPFASGWYQASTGMAAVYFRGGVGFRWTGHGIDFSSASPEIEINGASSRAIFTFAGTNNTKFEDQRGVLVNLDPSSIQASPAGSTVVYSDIPGTIPGDIGESVFAGFYPADAPFGTMTLSFTSQGP